MLTQTTRPLAVRVELPHDTFTIPPLPAADWLVAIGGDERNLSVVPGLLPPEQQAVVVDLLLSGDISRTDLERAGERALAEAAGRPWWEAVRLIGAADTSDGLLVGELTLNGVDPEKVPIARWCAAVYALLVRNLDTTERMKLDAKISVPPAGYEEEMTFDAQDMMRLARSMPGMRVGQ